MTIVSDLRELANWLEAHPDIAACTHSKNSIGVRTVDTDEFTRFVRTVGSGTKNAADGYAWLSRSFGQVELTVFGDVCQQVQVETQTVTVKEYPPDVEPVLVDVEVPVFEWRCPESFLAGQTERAS